MYTETSEAILAPKTIQYAKTSNIFHQNQNQSISLTLSPKSVGSIIDSRCPSHQRIMIPGPSKPFSTLYVDESVCIHTYIHTYISIYLSAISTHRTSFLFPSHFRVSSSAIVSARSTVPKDLSLRASTKRPSRRAKRPRTQSSNSLKRTYAPPNLRVRPLHVRLLVVSWHVLSRS